MSGQHAESKEERKEVWEVKGTNKHRLLLHASAAVFGRLAEARPGRFVHAGFSSSRQLDGSRWCGTISSCSRSTSSPYGMYLILYLRLPAPCKQASLAGVLQGIYQQPGDWQLLSPSQHQPKPAILFGDHYLQRKKDIICWASTLHGLA